MSPEDQHIEYCRAWYWSWTGPILVLDQCSDWCWSQMFLSFLLFFYITTVSVLFLVSFSDGCVTFVSLHWSFLGHVTIVDSQLTVSTGPDVYRKVQGPHLPASIINMTGRSSSMLPQHSTIPLTPSDPPQRTQVRGF